MQHVSILTLCASSHLPSPTMCVIARSPIGLLYVIVSGASPHMALLALNVLSSLASQCLASSYIVLLALYTLPCLTSRANRAMCHHAWPLLPLAPLHMVLLAFCVPPCLALLSFCMLLPLASQPHQSIMCPPPLPPCGREQIELRFSSNMPQQYY